MSESRENLIQNAVRFLQDPSVQASPVSGRITFLEKKGLSSDEIDRALSLAGLSRPSNSEHANNNTGSMKQLATQLGSAPPPLPANGPSTALKKLATSEGFSWSRLFLYVAVTSGLLAAIRNSPAANWIKYAYRKLRSYLLTLIYGEESLMSPCSYRSSPSVSIDRLAEIREEIAELRSTIADLNERVESTVRDEVQQVKNTVKIAYGKLEGDLEDLREMITQ